MSKSTKKDRLLLDVECRHPYTSRDGKRHNVYVMHPQRNIRGEGAGHFSIRKDSDTRRQQYVTDAELAELFAVNGFADLGINLRMLPHDKYEGGAAPGLQPSMSDVTAGSAFELAVNEQRSEIRQRGLSSNLHSKLIEIGVGLPDRLLSRDPMDVPTLDVANNGQELADSNSRGGRRSISETDLLDILNRQRENGAAGERIVIVWEKMRLKDCGCSAPDDFVTHTSKVNVAAGFDIHSHWTSDQERFIEVKTTASGADYFFMSQNEKCVLTDKADKSYIYIVDLDSSGKDTGTVRTPIRFAEAAFEFEPVAYRVHLKQ